MTARGIQSAGGYPAIVAAVVALAVEDARSGDLEALEWLQDDAGWWLSWLTPAHVDVEDVRGRLLERARPPAGTACQTRLGIS